MKSEQQYFDQAISLQEYMENMDKHKENSFTIYDQFQVPKDDEFIALLKEKSPRILGITEDWCGDAMMNNPILRRIAEAADIDVRMVYRDQTLDLMDRYLTNGGRSIPVYLLLNKEGEVIANWGPRAPKLQEYVMELRQGLPAPENATFKDKQKEFIEKLTAEYIATPEYWLWVYEDIRKEFIAALQRKR
ncbi:thioredoxin family protein [Paenisporosarcina sp. TG20]|uniref:thioredoxin family protein n=1 Tax=Paenisporosarcina sp. TG20 TaxID=1211706 RepID=UPI00031C89C6|nr:thioredoxin family protein [Paenisporosarcina sp. TG20]